jgi:hypothetical protein
MTQYLKKNKGGIEIDHYIDVIRERCVKNIPNIKNPQKVSLDNMYIPAFHEYNTLCNYSYNGQQLKLIAKHYKLKTSGNKKELLHRLYTHFLLSSYILKIQKRIRGFIQRKYNMCHGPAYKNRSLCTNKTDFFTMEDLQDLDKEQFFSYEDDDGFIYGFDLVSLHNLIYKTEGVIKNPYNRRTILPKVITTFRTLLRLSKLLHIPICINIKDIEEEITAPKSIELRTLNLFQNIDSLGNYSSPSWFMDLGKEQLIKLLRELCDIWTYRAPLTMETKRSICPPHGNPFGNTSIVYLHRLHNLDEIRKIVLSILDNFVNTGIDRDNKCLGAFYVLGALTLVSAPAAASLPWLYESVTYV